jgi:hypothetical protein
MSQGLYIGKHCTPEYHRSLLGKNLKSGEKRWEMIKGRNWKGKGKIKGKRLQKI